MNVLRISLLGKFNVCYGEQPLAGLDARRVKELFCYLLLHRNRSHPREFLASLLWYDCSTSQSKKYLRQALWHLQAALGANLEPRVLLAEPEWVQLNVATNLWLDVAVFEQAFALVEEVSGQELDPQTAQTVRAAVQLYQGDLLEGWYQDWCLYERERLQSMYLTMLDKLVAYCETHHIYETGLAYGTRLLSYERAHERTHRRLMRLYYLAGDRTAALRQYDQCLAALEAELEVKPSKRTVALYEQIRADQFESWSQAPSQIGSASAPTIVLLPDILARLKQLQAALADLQRQVEQDIQAVEQTTGGQR